MSNSKIALVTGGSRGLGKDSALRLAEKGNDVVITYNTNKAEAESTVKSIESLGRKAAALKLNVTESSTFDEFFSEFEKILAEKFNAPKFDFLINNAGMGLHAPFDSVDESQFDLIVNTHFKGYFFLAQKALKLINDGGVIINVTSGLARFAMPGASVYGSMKAALDTLARYQAKELGLRGIRVNSLAPGAIATDFGGGLVRDNKELNASIASGTALGRVGRPDDIGGVVAFLCSEDAKWINGQRIEVSGGVML